MFVRMSAALASHRAQLLPKLALACALPCLGAAGCIADYSEPEPPVLEQVPELGEDDALVFVRELRWWSAPTSQRLVMYERADGSFYLRRQAWDGSATYAWAEGTLTSAGDTRLEAARASFDPTMSEPAPGNYECTYYDALPASIYEGEERYDFASLCPPQGMSELAALYRDLSELLLDCPLDESWYEGELPLTQSDCEAAE